MADKLAQYGNNLSGASFAFTNGVGGTILQSMYFDAPAPPSSGAKYSGARSRVQVYLGNRSNAQLYLGVGSLFSQ